MDRRDFWSITSYTAGFLNANLLTLQIMVNDGVVGTSAAQWKAAMQAAITDCRVNGADILLLTSPPAQGVSMVPYIAAAYELADTNDVPLYDMTDRWGDYNTANAIGLMADGWHAGPSGHAEEGHAIMTVLGL